MDTVSISPGTTSNSVFEPPTPDQLRQRISELEAQLEVKKLRARIAELERELAGVDVPTTAEQPSPQPTTFPWPWPGVYPSPTIAPPEIVWPHQPYHPWPTVWC